MTFTAQQIAEIIDGKVVGNPDATVSYVSKIEEGKKGTISFLANPKYKNYIYDTKATIVIMNKSLTLEKETKATLIIVDDAYTAFAHLLEVYNKINQNKSGISDKAHIASSARIGNEVYVGEFSVIGENAIIGANSKIYPRVFIGDNVVVGENTIIHPGVNIYSDNKIGSNCIIHAGAVLGSDGFGFAPQADGNYKKIAQIGNVVVEDNVEIGANTTIDRATMGSTIIRNGVKLDNLIQIAHNVEIGENTVISAQTGISGTTKIGKNCLIGGQVGIIHHITIADEVKIAAQSGIGKSILKKGEIVQGSPAFDISSYKKSYVHFKNFHSIKLKLDELEKLITENS